MDRKEIIGKAKLIVIKVGTNVLTTKDGSVDLTRMREIVGQIARLIQSGKQVVLVTSGAIGLGKKELGISGKIRQIPLRQACAAIGQNTLMYHYKNFFSQYGINMGQLLLTYDTFVNRASYLNLKNAFDEMLRLKVVPVINENDPISINEIDISFGDNDKLSALVASKLKADVLLILTDVDGLYDRDPRQKGAQLVSEVADITADTEKLAGSGKSSGGTGGMITKINAARIATEAGVAAIVANGYADRVVTRVFDGESIGTIFYSKGKMSSKRVWLKNTKVLGLIVVDDGAAKALRQGKNLLPAGITEVKGSFKAGEVVEIRNNSGVFAKAISDYSAEDLQKIKGKGKKDIGTARNITKRENLVIL